MSLRSSLYRLSLSVLLLIICGSVATGQSSIFFVPSTDTQTEKSALINAESYFHFDKYLNGGFQTVGPSVVYGLRKDLEIGVNFYYTKEEGPSAFELRPNIKWKAYNNQKNNIAVSVGSMIFIPLNKAAGTRTSAMLYANASKTFDAAKGLRLTGGIYRIAGGDEDFGTKTGALVGVEQPIAKKLTLLADWTSGRNKIGYSNIGFGYEAGKSQYFAIAYTIGNSGRTNNFLSVFYGFTF